jgi:hypothetical protein
MNVHLIIEVLPPAFKVKSIFTTRKCGSVEVCVPVFEVLPPAFEVQSILMARPGSCMLHISSYLISGVLGVS